MTDQLIHVGDGRKVYASYGGGAYVELSFGRPGVPTEVINVWDHETGKPQIEESPEAVEAVVLAWARTNDEEWPEWYEGYLENANY